MSADHEATEDEGSGDLSRVFRPRRALPTDVVRPTRAEVDLAALRHNLRVLRRVTAGVPIWGVLKADAYGHGAKAVARTLERAGMDGVCVALVEEGVELREAGISCPILVMGGYYGPASRELAHFGLTPVLVDQGQVERLSRELDPDIATQLEVHLKLDTGMGRLGVRRQEWGGFAEALRRSSNLKLSGLMTHFACADDSDPAALNAPMSAFADACQLFQQKNLQGFRRHAANSAAVLRSRSSHFELVRPGVALYGVDPLPKGAPRVETLPQAGRLRPVMSVSSRIVALRQLQVGDGVGYGQQFIAQRPTVVGTVPIGYADGLSRSLSGRGALLVRGRRAPIAGIVSMDMTTVDVTDLPGVAVGDEAMLLGSQSFDGRTETITAEEIAGWMGSIAWEVLTNISRRVPRFYREA